MGINERLRDGIFKKSFNVILKVLYLRLFPFSSLKSIKLLSIFSLKGEPRKERRQKGEISKMENI